MKNKINKHWIQTYTGKKVDLLAPIPDDICLEDIAWSLSNICRFNGHCKRFYSVAEHSILASQNVPKQYAMEALLHDAAEAYIGDIASPLKSLWNGIKYIEENIMTFIAAHFELDLPFHPYVKEVDNALLTTEANQMMIPLAKEWPQFKEKPLCIKIEYLLPLNAYYAFKKQYKEIKENQL